MVVLNLSTPFFYLMDIVKDCIQLLLLLSVVGGLWLFLEHWLNFTSVVSLDIMPLYIFKFYQLISHLSDHMVLFLLNCGSINSCRLFAK